MDTPTERMCTDCRELKPWGEFIRKGGVGYLDRCPSCRTASQKRRRAKYRDRQAVYRRRAVLAKFGLTADEYEIMLAAQGGVCAMCSETCATGRRLAVDHDHDTGLVRGLLCYICNQRLGQFEAIRDAAEKFLHDYGSGNPHISHGEALRHEGPSRPVGSAVPSSRLTERRVREMRARYAQGGITHRGLAQEYDVSLQCVGSVLRRKTWKHVEDAA